jgi:hypothetical protein
VSDGMLSAYAELLALNTSSLSGVKIEGLEDSLAVPWGAYPGSGSLSPGHISGGGRLQGDDNFYMPSFPEVLLTILTDCVVVSRTDMRIKGCA